MNKFLSYDYFNYDLPLNLILNFVSKNDSLTRLHGTIDVTHNTPSMPNAK